jgi:hypothetical protein
MQWCGSILQYVSAVQLSHHQADDGYTKININGERSLFNILQQYYSKNGTLRLKLIHNHVTEFLRYNLYGTV